MLNNVNRQRLAGVEINNTQDLLSLLQDNERLYYIYLIDAYRNKKDLTGILSGEFVECRVTVSLICNAARDSGEYNEIVEYFKQFIYPTESSEQAIKVVNELRMEKKRNEVLMKLDEPR